MSRPRPLPDRIVALAARSLPPAHRERYWQEFTTELYDVAPSSQLPHALRLLSSSWALRAALTEAAPATIGDEDMTTTTRPRIPLLCRLNLKHTWHRYSTEDGQRYSACTKCGREKPDRSGNIQPSPLA